MPKNEPSGWENDAGQSEQPLSAELLQKAAPKLTPWGTPLPEAVETKPGGPKMTPWGAPIPEAEEEVEWGAEVKPEEGELVDTNDSCLSGI